MLATQLLTHKTSTPEEDAGTETNTATAAAFTTEPGKVPTPRTEVLVTVPVFALLGLTDEPAELDGYGPIPASMARKLLADGAESFHRVLIDPRDGAPLEIGRTSYRLTKAMKKALQLRDGKCAFPGCNNNSLDNETDHLQAWQHGGTTGISNLAQLCPKHHRLKHNSRWTPTAATKDKPPGWTSPSGRYYQAEQPDWEPSQWPPSVVRLRGPYGIRPARAPKSTGAPGVGGDDDQTKVEVSALEDALKRAAPPCMIGPQGITGGTADYFFCA
ncbi:HNH endonuclease [Arthrobacter sp. MPF02]|uniref:HNH endonuclease signature motif containing protein n=1 Tax=Arthrobacter sp. MPF02 TaxID=3388492 RepID=UPI0039850CC6